MMKCEFCDENATIHLTKVVEGAVQKLHLCATCAKEKGYTSSTSFSVSDILLGADKTIAKGGKNPHCPTCGMTAGRFQKGGRLGCARCYSVFRPQVEELLHSMHASLKHQGRFPQRSWHAQALRQKMETLELSLDKAVEDEQYEEAARIRDELTVLAAELSGEGA